MSSYMVVVHGDLPANGTQNMYWRTLSRHGHQARPKEAAKTRRESVSIIKDR